MYLTAEEIHQYLTECQAEQTPGATTLTLSKANWVELLDTGILPDRVESAIKMVVNDRHLDLFTVILLEDDALGVLDVLHHLEEIAFAD